MSRISKLLEKLQPKEIHSILDKATDKENALLYLNALDALGDVVDLEIEYKKDAGSLMKKLKIKGSKDELKSIEYYFSNGNANARPSIISKSYKILKK